MRELISLPSEASMAALKGHGKPYCPGHQERRGGAGPEGQAAVLLPVWSVQHTKGSGDKLSQPPGRTPPCNAKPVPCSYLTAHTGGQVEASKSSYQGKATAYC